MKKQLAALSLLAVTATASADDFNIYAGPHFNYTRVHFNAPHRVEGYQGGVTGGFNYQGCYWIAQAEFDGTWDAGPMTGKPCVRADIWEYYLVGRVGASLCTCRTYFQPYTGFGGDQFNYVQEPDTLDIKNKFEKIFVPFGLIIKQERETVEAGIQLEYRLDVGTRLKVAGEKFTPSKKWGYRAQGFLQFHSCNDCFWLTLAIAPFFDWNKFGKSKSNGVEIERLIRWNAGLRILLGYEF